MTGAINESREREAYLSGLLTALGPLLLLILPPGGEATGFIALGGCGLISLGGFIFTFRSLAGRLLSTLGFILWTGCLVPFVYRSPARSLVLVIGAAILFEVLWRTSRRTLSTPRRPLRRDGEYFTRRATSESLIAALGWILYLFGAVSLEFPGSLALVVLYLPAPLSLAIAVVKDRLRPAPRHLLPLGGAVIGYIGMGLTWRNWPLFFGWGTLASMSVLVFSLMLEKKKTGTGYWLEPFVSNPARMLISTFLMLSFVGAVLLSLPACSSSGQSIGFIDALFTSVSAVCVTGLIILDTPHDFTWWGQAVILLLIQVGGLGIMTFSTAALAAFRRRLSLRHESIVAGLLSQEDRGNLFLALRRILAVTFVAEALGFLVLGLLFVFREEQPLAAVWRGLFTSISAFCNAGFALQSDSLAGYRQQGLVLHVIAGLIIIGGLSPAIVVAGRRRLTHKRLPLQAKLALSATAVLLVLGAVSILAVEWSRTLAGLPLAAKLHNAWFQSVTARTAGFNSLDMAALQPTSLMVIIGLMFIGGCPGGTAGGVKTTTVAVLFFMVIGALRSRWEATAFGRRISTKSLFRAVAVFIIGLSMVAFSFVALRLTQAIAPRDALFEVVSALGTVGLSTGATARLDTVGKAIIILCMFIGRVGLLTLFLFLAERTAGPQPTLIEEEIDVS